MRTFPVRAVLPRVRHVERREFAEARAQETVIGALRVYEVSGNRAAQVEAGDNRHGGAGYVDGSANFGNVNNPTPYGYGGGVTILGSPTGPGYSDALDPIVIRGNFIGTNARGEHPGNNLIGMPASNAGGGVAALWMLPMRIESNLIAYNGFTGNAAITARTAALNLNTANEQLMPPRRLVVLSNSIYCNGALAEGETCGQGMAIDWSASKTNMPSPAVGDGPTLNDDGDVDDGPAELSYRTIPCSLPRPVA